MNIAKRQSESQYTLSLLKEALTTGYISKEETDYFQFQIMNILKDLIMRYTKGESTSVTVSTAENLLNSLFYSLDTGLKSLNETDAAYDAIKLGNVYQIYNRGLSIISACFKESKELYLNIRKGRQKVGLEAYDTTIDEALPTFFEKYGAVFDAHSTMASIDYPLLFNDESITGIFYINRYLETLWLETEFCSLFSDKEVAKVLTTYGHIYNIDYTKTLTNIFELVLNASFFSALSDSSADSLAMSGVQYEILQKKLSEMNPLQLNLVIDETMNKLIHDLNITNLKLLNYVERYKEVLSARLNLALETHTLKKLVLVEDVLAIKTDKTVFIGGEKMMDDDFRILIDKLTDGINSTEKIDIIRSESHSLEDFIDILEAGCLFEDEYILLFSKLNNLELGVLARVIFSDELRDESADLTKIIQADVETGVEWHEYMVEFLKTLNNEQLGYIGTQMNSITDI